MGAWVYFVQAENAGLIKIGHTRTDPAARLAALRTSSPLPLIPLGVLPGGPALEHALHRPLIALAYRDHR